MMTTESHNALLTNITKHPKYSSLKMPSAPLKTSSSTSKLKCRIFTLANRPSSSKEDQNNPIKEKLI